MMKPKYRDKDRHSASHGYLNLTIKNGKLRSSMESKELQKTTLPKIQINKLNIGEAASYETFQPKSDLDNDPPIDTMGQSERELQRSSERVKRQAKHSKKKSNPYKMGKKVEVGT